MLAESRQKLNQDQHLAADTNDLLNQLVYISAIQANATLAKGEFKKAMKNAPEPIDRGEEKPKKEKPRFLSGKELLGKVADTKVKVIEHTNACMKGKIYANTGKCDCPAIERGGEG